MHGVTIAARRDLARAAVLATSFRAVHPHAHFTVVVIDADVDEYRHACADGVMFIAARELPLAPGEFHRWAMLYEAEALRQVLKPWAVQMRFDAGDEVVVLLDPDIVVYGSLEEVERQAQKDSIVLVPHTTEPPARDDLRPSEDELLAAGVYDLGFMAFSQDATPMLDWWKSGLRRATYAPPVSSTTQRWIDLVPAYFEHAVLRDPGYNVGYKNLATRIFESRNERLFVNDAELRFCHFTGYEPATPWLLSAAASDNPRALLSEHPIMRELCDVYGTALVAAQAVYPEVSYRFDRLSDGTVINTALRELYGHSLTDSERRGVDGPPLPFSGDDAAVTAWFREPVRPQAHLNRFLYGVWEIRPDLRNAFPYPLGANAAEFVDWAWLSKNIDSHLIPSLLPARVPPDRPATLATNARGVNLAGYFMAELGVGEMARLLVDGIKSCNIPFSTLTTRQTASRQNAQFEEAGSIVRYPVTIAAVNADVFIPWTHEVGPEFLDGRYLAALWAWEVEKYPDNSTAIAMVDEIWTLSRFGQEAIARTTDKPVYVIPLPVHEPPPHLPLRRAELGIPDGPFLLFAFDYFSVIERKNPFAVINAFSAAFKEGDGPSLVIKSINGALRRADRERLLRACAQRRDIFLLEDYLDAPVVSSLMGEALGYVSLHRAEGFGLTMAEAMARGVPVVATGYSGNLEFMNPDNSLLVPFTMVNVPPGCDPYPQSTQWAQADIDVAATHLRWLYDNPTQAAELGQVGKASVLSTCSMERTTRFLNGRLDDMLDIALGHRKERTTQMAATGKVEPHPSAGAAIARARRAVDEVPDLQSPSRMPAVATRFRRVVYRLLAHHDENSRRKLAAVLDALALLEKQQVELGETVSEIDGRLQGVSQETGPTGRPRRN
jgi:glycosyltransferase involved in cell wall biosynthesis